MTSQHGRGANYFHELTRSEADVMLKREKEKHLSLQTV